MKVVVTGAGGLLGRHVAQACHEAGHEVLGIDLLGQGPKPWQIVTADLCDFAQTIQLFQGADAVANCAAIPRPTGVAPCEVWRVNMAAIYAAVEAGRLSSIKRFVQASSFSVLGYPFATPLPLPHYLPIDEQHPVAAQDIYGTTKWLSEELIEAATRAGHFSAVSLRMPWVQTPESFYRDIGARRKTPASAADLWAYIDARDAASAFVAALEAPLEGHLRCYISAPDSYSQDETATLVAKTFPSLSRATFAAPYASLIDFSLAQKALNFTPRFSWRDYPIAE